MPVDAIFNGPPTALTPNSGSGVASLGLDVTSGLLYFRTLSNGWAEVAGSGLGSFVSLSPAAVQTVSGSVEELILDNLKTSSKKREKTR
jgi:hypothetical protein